MLLKMTNTGITAVGDLAANETAWVSLDNAVTSIDLDAAGDIVAVRFTNATVSPVNDADFESGDTGFSDIKMTAYNIHPKVGGYVLFTS